MLGRSNGFDPLAARQIDDSLVSTAVLANAFCNGSSGDQCPVDDTVARLAGFVPNARFETVPFQRLPLAGALQLK